MVGDLVILSKDDLHICNNRKFAARFIEPFKVLKYIVKLVCHIELTPIYSSLHNIFHVSKLKLYIPSGGNGTITKLQLFLVHGEEQYEVEKTMSECGYSNYKQYLVRWVGYSAKHDLWVPESKLI